MMFRQMEKLRTFRMGLGEGGVTHHLDVGITTVFILFIYSFSFSEITNIEFIDNGILMLQVIYKLKLEIPDLTVLPVTL